MLPIRSAYPSKVRHLWVRVGGSAQAPGAAVQLPGQLVGGHGADRGEAATEIGDRGTRNSHKSSAEAPFGLPETGPLRGWWRVSEIWVLSCF